MAREATLNVYAFTLPGLPRRLRVRGHALTASVMEGPRRRGAVAVIAERVAGPPSLSEESLREQHAIVMDLWQRTGCLLPVRFGTVLGERELRTRVAAAVPSLMRSLHHVRGRVQMTVRLFGEPSAGDTAGPAGASGTAYLQALRDRSSAIADLAAAVRGPVLALVEDERVDPGQGTLRLSVYHLIAAADEPRYRSALASVARAMPARAAISGPWPPFAFAPELWR